MPQLIAVIGWRTWSVTYRRKAPKHLLTVREVAELWGVSEARVKFLCGQGRVPGAYRKRKGKGRPWAIPGPVPILTAGSRGPAPKTAKTV